MNKPKIAFLIPRLGIIDRGAEVFVYELAKKLSQNFSITLYVRKSEKQSQMILDLEKHGIRVKMLNCITAERVRFVPALDKFHISPTELEMLSFSIMSMPQLLKSDFDILFPVNGIWGAILCRIIRAFRKIPFVYTSVGGIEPLIAKQKPNMYFTINPKIKRWLKSHFPKLSVEFISTGVDLEKFKLEGPRAQITLPRPIFLTVSALVPEKRIDLTIKAVGKLKQGSLLVVGDGPLKSELMKMAEEYLSKDRFIFQSVKYDNLPKFYRAADVFAFSAPKEVGWGMVHLEALASGLPVVANKEENLEFLMNEQGFLCDVENIEEYSLCLEKASKKKRGMYWRNKVKNYSWEKIAGQYKEILLGIVNDYKKND